MTNDGKCCETCDYFKDSLCTLWTAGDTVCIEDIENPMSEVCDEWDGDEEEQIWSGRWASIFHPE